MDIQKIRNMYLSSPPDGMTKKQIQSMSEYDLLEMHSFMCENNEPLDENEQE